jgi:2'-5' RNA ligase
VKRIAVDVVLLPDPAVAEKAIAINRALVERSGSEIVLDAENCLPHVSLAMGCINPKDLDVAGQVLGQIARENSPGPLKIIGVAVITNIKGRKVSSLLIDKTEPLQGLHERIMRDLGPFLTYDVRESMLFGQGPFSDTTLQWIRTFGEKSSLSRFWPHITLGYGEAASIDRPVSFVASALALCHLGNHCTCRKVMTSIEWGERGMAPLKPRNQESECHRGSISD